MTSPKTLIVTIPGMIGEMDLIPLRKLSHVEYHESKQAITEIELAKLCAGAKM